MQLIKRLEEYLNSYLDRKHVYYTDTNVSALSTLRNWGQSDKPMQTHTKTVSKGETKDFNDCKKNRR